MKYVAILTALGLASAASLVFADDNAAGAQPGAHHRHGMMMEKLRAADTNGDGLISRQEAAALPHLAQQFDAIDADHDGQLSKDELKAFFKARREQMAAAWFKKVDTDGDGRISKAEAQAGAPRLAAHFDKIDTNGDGFLSPEELAAAHQHRHHHRDSQQQPSQQ
jgi:Ca2+-binding EF-hand superfamily protein